MKRGFVVGFVLLGTVVVLCVPLLMILYSKQHIQQNNLGNVCLDIMQTHLKRPGYFHYTSQDPNLAQFYRSLQRNIQKGLRDDKQPPVTCDVNQRDVHSEMLNRWFHKRFSSSPDVCSNFTHTWWFTKQSHVDYWNRYGSMFRSAIRQALEAQGYRRRFSDIVVHLRLGDVPFVFHRLYHLQFYHYFDWALQRLCGDKKPYKIRLVYSFYWKDKEQRNVYMQKYLNDLVNYMRQQGHTVCLQTGSILDDFATMFFAHRFVGSQGSFAFCACVGRDPTTFCMPMLGYEKGQKRKDYRTGDYVVCPNPPTWMYHRKPLLHAHLVQARRTYEDVDWVCSQLRQV